MAKNKKYFLTKYWATKGVVETEAELMPGNTLRVQPDGKFPTYHRKPYWYENREEAVKHCEILRKKRISALELNIMQLKNKTFK